MTVWMEDGDGLWYVVSPARERSNDARVMASLRYRASEKGKAALAAAKRRYQASEKGKAAARRYQLSEKGKAAARRYQSGEKGKAAQRTYIARLKARCLALVGPSCRGCGSDLGLQFAHIKPTELSGGNGRGRIERYLDVLRHPDCYAVLCRSCHLSFDQGNELLV